MTTDDTTIKTSSTSALNAWRQARQALVSAIHAHEEQHTTATKQAIKQAQEEEARRLHRYSEIRMHELTVVAQQQRRRND
jgi:hypothetical protein